MIVAFHGPALSRLVGRSRADISTRKRAIERQRAELRGALAPGRRLRRNFSKVLNGAALELDGAELARVRALPAVRAVFEDRQVAALLRNSRTSVRADRVEDVLGSSLADNITGNARDNTLEGGLGNDTLAGGTGDDVYVFAQADSDDDLGADTVTEAASLDADTLDFSDFGGFGETVTVDLSSTSLQAVHDDLDLTLSDATAYNVQSSIPLETGSRICFNPFPTNSCEPSGRTFGAPRVSAPSTME